MNERISIIIPAQRYDSELELLINTLLKQTRIADEILVVIKEDHQFRSNPDDIRIKILIQSGKGPANARNLAAQESNGKILVFIDSDCLPADQNWLLSLLSGISNTGADVVCGRIIVTGSSIISQFIRTMKGLGTPDYGLNAFFVKEHFIGFPATNMAIKKEVFERIGGFDEKLIISEDVDFFWRLWNKGIIILYNPDALMFHRHRTSLFKLLKHAFHTGKGSIGFLQKYGFFNRFHKGTCLAALLILLMPLFLWMIQNPFTFAVIAVEFYLISLLIFYKKRESTTRILTTFASPILLAFYSISLGLGVWCGYLYNILEKWFR